MNRKTIGMVVFIGVMIACVGGAGIWVLVFSLMYPQTTTW